MDEKNVGVKSVHTVDTKSGGVFSVAFNVDGTLLTLNVVERVSDGIRHPITTVIGVEQARVFADSLLDKTEADFLVNCEDDFETTITVNSSGDHGKVKELHFRDNDGTEMTAAISRVVAYAFAHIIRTNMASQ